MIPILMDPGNIFLLLWCDKDLFVLDLSELISPLLVGHYYFTSLHGIADLTSEFSQKPLFNAVFDLRNDLVTVNGEVVGGRLTNPFLVTHRLSIASEPVFTWPNRSLDGVPLILHGHVAKLLRVPHLVYRLHRRLLPKRGSHL